MAVPGFDAVGKWAAGANYGPVFTQTEIFLLETKLEINPIFDHGGKSKFNLVFNLATGQTGGFNENSRDQDLPFNQKDEPATLPRVAELVIITKASPWCTIVKNPAGVSLANVCEALWTEYTNQLVTEAEFTALPPRLQEQVKRSAMSNLAQMSGAPGYMGYMHGNSQPRRLDWLREKIYFDGIDKDDEYVKKRLGYNAPNVFVMHLQS